MNIYLWMMGGPVPYIHVAADTPCTCTLTDTPYHLFQHRTCAILSVELRISNIDQHGQGGTWYRVECSLFGSEGVASLPAHLNLDDLAPPGALCHIQVL